MPKLNCHLPVLALSLASLTAAPARAAEDSDTIIVTALRTPVEADKVSSSVTVLDQAAIAREQPIAVTDILLRTPGISLSRNGGYGTDTSLRIRGANSGQSVMVIDGMRLADPSTTDGGYNFANLFADDIAQIEILRGPQAILWGSSSIGGVIAVQTRHAQKRLEESFSVEAGSRGTVYARASLSGKSDQIDWRVAGSAFTTDGISARANGTEPDGSRRQSASAALAYHLTPALTLDLRGYFANSRYDFDSTSGDAPVYGTQREGTGYVGLNLALFDGRLTQRLAAVLGDTARKNYDPRRANRMLTFDANGRSHRYEYQGTFTPSALAQVTFGAEREEQRMTNASPGDTSLPYTLTPTSADLNSLYAQARLTPVKGLTVNGGGRYDDHSRFGGHTVWSAGAVYSVAQTGTVLRVSYDQGFKAPSLYQLFSSYGSTALQPEKAKGWEVGAQQSLLGRHLDLSATWYERKTQNLIDFAFCPTSGALPAACYLPGTTTTRFGYYANVKQAQAHGLELGGALHLGRATASGNYSIVVAQDRTPGSTYGLQLARVPRHLANAELGYDFGHGVSASAAARYAGASRDSASSAVVLGDYWLFDLRAEWQPVKALTFYTRAENLGDRHYQTANGYGALGRSVYFGLRSRF
jgi:vitamin B12 transporter